MSKNSIIISTCKKIVDVGKNNFENVLTQYIMSLANEKRN